MIRKLLPLALVGVIGCTPAQINAWIEWHETDPAAAIEFANRPEIQAALEQRNRYTNNHAAEWERIAWCESGRQWHLRASNRTGTYGGGLMIADYVWRAYGGQEFGATADQATKEQQIHIAERILADVGWKAWDCA